MLWKLELYYNQNSPQTLFRICYKNIYSGFHRRGSLLGFRKIGLYKISENFLRNIFIILYLTKLQTSDLYVSTLLKKIVLQKHIEITFNSKGDYYYLKKNIYIWMQMPTCQWQDSQGKVLSIFKDKYIKDKSLSGKWMHSKKKYTPFL